MALGPPRWDAWTEEEEATRVEVVGPTEEEEEEDIEEAVVEVTEVAVAMAEEAIIAEEEGATEGEEGAIGAKEEDMAEEAATEVEGGVATVVIKRKCCYAIVYFACFSSINRQTQTLFTSTSFIPHIESRPVTLI